MENPLNETPNLTNEPKSDLSINLQSKELTKMKVVKWVMILFVPLITLNIVLYIVKSNISNVSITHNNDSTGVYTNSSTNNSGGVGQVNNESVQFNQNPNDVVKKFLGYNKSNDKSSALELLSKDANKEAFSSTITGSDVQDSLYGKDFTYNIYYGSTESTSGDSLVNVEIFEGGKSYVIVFTLVQENGNWLLANKEIFKPSS